MIRVCVVCKKVFGEKPPYEDKSVTHGICEICFPKEMERMRRELEEIKRDKKWEKKSENRPVIRLKIKECPLAERDHRKSKRVYAHYGHLPQTICVSREIYRIPANHTVAIIAHEIGHALGGDTEKEANRIAEDLFGIKIRYINRTPWGNWLQYISHEDIKKVKKRLLS